MENNIQELYLATYEPSGKCIGSLKQFRIGDLVIHESDEPFRDKNAPDTFIYSELLPHTNLLISSIIKSLNTPRTSGDTIIFNYVITDLGDTINNLFSQYVPGIKITRVEVNNTYKSRVRSVSMKIYFNKVISTIKYLYKTKLNTEGMEVIHESSNLILNKFVKSNEYDSLFEADLYLFELTSTLDKLFFDVLKNIDPVNHKRYDSGVVPASYRIWKALPILAEYIEIAHRYCKDLHIYQWYTRSYGSGMEEVQDICNIGMTHRDGMGSTERTYLSLNRNVVEALVTCGCATSEGITNMYHTRVREDDDYMTYELDIKKMYELSTKTSLADVITYLTNKDNV